MHVDIGAAEVSSERRCTGTADQAKSPAADLPDAAMATGKTMIPRACVKGK